MKIFNNRGQSLQTVWKETRETALPGRARRNLREARLRDKPVPITEADLPNKDIQVSEDFIRKQEHVVMWLGHALARVMEARRSVDGDAREGLESLIKTYRTLESGLIYE